MITFFVFLLFVIICLLAFVCNFALNLHAKHIQALEDRVKELEEDNKLLWRRIDG